MAKRKAKDWRKESKALSRINFLRKELAKPVNDLGHLQPSNQYKLDRKQADFESKVEEHLNIRTFRHFTALTCQPDSKTLKKEKNLKVDDKACLCNVFCCIFNCFINLLRSCIY